MRVSSIVLACLALFPKPAEAQTLQAVLVSGGLADPVALCAPVGDFSRLFVLERLAGRIRIIKDGALLPAPFLDVSSIITILGEGGLLGIAFHPDYSVAGSSGEGSFFIAYTDVNADTVVSRYRVSANPDVAEPTALASIVTVMQPWLNHNGGCLRFGADRMLYAAMGDGGDSTTAQDPSRLLGKILRFDVDLPAPYIPASNPFVGDPLVRDEIWSVGLRNPWRFSFDRLTGDMWIADVGLWTYEEIDFEPAGAGGTNFGWPCMEGSLCSGAAGCNCGQGTTLPVAEYTHNYGCAVIGGYRYRGSAMPGFQGRYFYADYCGGSVWSMTFDGNVAGNTIDHRDELAIPGAEYISSFGEDAAGELYLLDRNLGRVFLLQEVCTTNATNYCPSSPNSSGQGATLAYSGSGSITSNDTRLLVSNAPAGVPGLFFYGQSQVSLPLGDGSLCVGGTIYRQAPAVFTGGAGAAQKLVDFNTAPEGSGASQIVAGSRWYFQFWYRDVAAGGAGFNLSSAVDVTFCR